MPEGSTPTPASTKKKVMVIGGGPAGMEAARIAAERGHVVTLYEKKGSLGGMMTFAAAIKGTHEKIADFTNYLVKQQTVKGVTVVTGKEIDAAFVDEQKPDVILVATGAKRPDVQFSSSPRVNVVPMQNVSSSTIGDTVVINGANFQATDLAMYLLKEDKTLYIVNSGTADDVDKEQPGWIKTAVIPYLKSKGVRIFNNASVKSVNDSTVTITTTYGDTESITCNTLIECGNMIADTTLYDALKTKYTTYAIGDCSAPSTISEAVAAGNLTARKL
jgi:pyruvate/2-oxoglutarate dehydrogenase complex dihydrolipoamide dehydrogenase (E3) component